MPIWQKPKYGFSGQKKINFFDDGYSFRGVWGGTLMHELVLARMEPRMEPELLHLYGRLPTPIIRKLNKFRFGMLGTAS